MPRLQHQLQLRLLVALLFAWGVLLRLVHASGVATCGRKPAGADLSPLPEANYRRRSLIVGGQAGSACEWSWHVALVQIARTTHTDTNPITGVSRTVERTSWTYRCGGSLLDETHVLTAAHCVDGLTAEDTLHVLVGVSDLKEVAAMTVEELERRVVAVQVVHIHPGYYGGADATTNPGLVSAAAAEEAGGPAGAVSAAAEQDDGASGSGSASASATTGTRVRGNGRQRPTNTRRNLATVSGNLLYDYAVLGLVAPPNTGVTAAASSDDTDFIDDIADFISGNAPADITASANVALSGGSPDGRDNLNQNFIPELMLQTCPGTSAPLVSFICIPDAPLGSEAIRRKYEGQMDAFDDMAVYADNSMHGYFSGDGENNLDDFHCVTTGFGQSAMGDLFSVGSGAATAMQETTVALSEHCSMWATNSLLGQFLQRISGDNFPSILCGSGINLPSSPAHSSSSSCAGDSGGPLVCRHKNDPSATWFQYGIVSQGRSSSGDVLEDCNVNHNEELETWFADTFYAREWILAKASMETNALAYDDAPDRTAARVFVVFLLLLILFVLLYEIFRVAKHGFLSHCVFRRLLCGCCFGWGTSKSASKNCCIRRNTSGGISVFTCCDGGVIASWRKNCYKRFSNRKNNSGSTSDVSPLSPNSTYLQMVRAQREYDAGLAQVPPAFLTYPTQDPTMFGNSNPPLIRVTNHAPIATAGGGLRGPAPGPAVGGVAVVPPVVGHFGWINQNANGMNNNQPQTSVYQPIPVRLTGSGAANIRAQHSYPANQPMINIHGHSPIITIVQSPRGNRMANSPRGGEAAAAVNANANDVAANPSTFQIRLDSDSQVAIGRTIERATQAKKNLTVVTGNERFEISPGDVDSVLPYLKTEGAAPAGAPVVAGTAPGAQAAA
mmetsp:Transcript_19068/g.47691  ORF Transcript_19068/g.47691 Transcript_19068/m.47691 type:complete len:898 (-) Transcript_19068:563-3256(-)|eukprot:CAMPEP_0178990928 /NCGR_PEP_ID=MMETSP0795-20121207/5237_1 /TAXON_ID=88552 /ORGANISM="Amoebophrya sp., Strain Ameob2" /LENGTH=897 /DNA_ID=CAMNT_0020682565 /DNA_START=362 /DNA_END=3055 /DNA_ORIENTATION=+